MKSGALGRLGDWLSLLASSETLEELPEAPVGRTRESLLAWLTKAETLQTDEPAAGKGRQSFLGRLFASERLPVDPVGGEAPGRGGRAQS